MERTLVRFQAAAAREEAVRQADHGDFDGAAATPPSHLRFDYRSVRDEIHVWGWSFAVQREHEELLDLTDVSCEGLTLRGTGTVTVAVPPSCQTGHEGRSVFEIDLGPGRPERLLGVAADVLRSFGSAFGGRHLAIVGGAVPTLLVPDPPRGVAPHVGTGDLDFHLSLHLLDGETADYYRAIIDGLRELGLEPASEDGREIRWRWIGRHRGVRLQVEFLCPVRDRAGRPESPAVGTPAEANIGPDGQITALAVG